MALNRRNFLAGLSLLAASSALRKGFEFEDFHSLKALYKDDFLFGNIITGKQLEKSSGPELELLEREFNALTMENDMKWQLVHPAPEVWHFDPVNRFMDFCDRHGHQAIGHVLVWHSQTPSWVFETEQGKPIGRQQLLDRMKGHIQTLAGHCKGRLYAWDVVNEAIEDNGTFRKSAWYQQIGADFIAEAFRTAHEADPSAQLLYNDYNMHIPAKRRAVVALIRSLKAQGIPIHGVGMQGHIGLDYPDLNEFEKSIKAFANEGVKIHISEIDIDVLPNPYRSAEISTRLNYAPWKDPYREGLPPAVSDEQADRGEALFKVLLNHKESIERVSFWGLADGMSWKNNFPIRGRVNYPLLWGRNFEEKEILRRLRALKSQ
ncbi:endo-1,4-beta-xylanase [Temperatibacter marinus]|uniref:Beta-xylanase n=1 Tax=Temperatibacter marinus TaxID=1456591 RepID=A0AA52H846_9PROT|nr:endo-1,4-beta-xylanase [Temperatibacter marinus]WND01746.1 endo-1,4-beta-xylanase [Temperatibacter marinus]